MEFLTLNSVGDEYIPYFNFKIHSWLVPKCKGLVAVSADIQHLEVQTINNQPYPPPSVATDQYIRISNFDVQSDYLNNKLVSTSGKITKNILNVGGNEQLDVDVDVSGIDINSLSGVLIQNKGGTGITSLDPLKVVTTNLTGQVISTYNVVQGDFVGTNQTQNLTFKTIDDPSNNVRANKIATSGLPVDTSGGAPPVAGQVLTATGASTAVWQTPAVGAKAVACMTYYDPSQIGTVTTINPYAQVTLTSALYNANGFFADVNFGGQITNFTGQNKLIQISIQISCRTDSSNSDLIFYAQDTVAGNLFLQTSSRSDITSNLIQNLSAVSIHTIAPNASLKLFIQDANGQTRDIRYFCAKLFILEI